MYYKKKNTKLTTYWKIYRELWNHVLPAIRREKKAHLCELSTTKDNKHL